MTRKVALLFGHFFIYTRTESTMTYMKRNIFSIAMVLCGTVAFTLGGSAFAISTGGIGARPANPDPNNERTKSIFVYDIEPGESKQDTVLVSNNTDENKKIEVYAVDGQTTNSGSFACKQKVEASTGAGAWIELDQSEIRLDAGKQQEIPFEVTLPKQVDVGEHNACIVVAEASSETQESGGGVSLRFRSALRVAISVPGDIDKSLSLDSIQLEQTSSGDYILVAQLENTGNVSLDADLKVSLNRFVGSSIENGGVFPVLPRENANIRLQIERPYWGGLHRAEADVTYDANPDNRLGQTDNADYVTKTVASNWQFIAPTGQAMAIITASLAVIAVLAVFVLYRKGIIRKPGHKDLVKYRVKPGQNLQSIAEAHNVNWKALARINQIKAPYSLKEGAIIKVPKPHRTKK